MFWDICTASADASFEYLFWVGSTKEAKSAVHETEYISAIPGLSAVQPHLSHQICDCLILLQQKKGQDLSADFYKGEK